MIIFRFKEYEEKDIIKAVEVDGGELASVKNQTEAICIVAVKQNGWALESVKEQTEAICLEAVKQDGQTLQYVKNQTEKVCIEAVKQDSNAIQFVEILSRKIYDIATTYKEEYGIELEKMESVKVSPITDFYGHITPAYERGYNRLYKEIEQLNKDIEAKRQTIIELSKIISKGE